MLVKEAAKNRLYVLTNPSFDRRQLVFPMDTTAPDYAEAVMLVVKKLAALEARSIQSILKSLLEVSDDSLAFRVATARSEGLSIPLSFVGCMIEGVQQMLLASVCTVLKPLVHHPALSRAEAQQFLESARFRHSQPGSFVLNVSCPVQAMDVQAPWRIDEPEPPFVRRAPCDGCVASISLPVGEKPVSFVRVQHDYFSRIEEVRRELRSPEE